MKKVEHQEVLSFFISANKAVRTSWERCGVQRFLGIRDKLKIKLRIQLKNGSS
jgi:hypothetical protein